MRRRPAGSLGPRLIRACRYRCRERSGTRGRRGRALFVSRRVRPPTTADSHVLSDVRYANLRVRVLVSAVGTHCSRSAEQIRADTQLHFVHDALLPPRSRSRSVDVEGRVAAELDRRRYPTSFSCTRGPGLLTVGSGERKPDAIYRGTRRRVFYIRDTHTRVRVSIQI